VKHRAFSADGREPHPFSEQAPPLLDSLLSWLKDELMCVEAGGTNPVVVSPISPNAVWPPRFGPSGPFAGALAELLDAAS